jgi:hypothetical protein
MKFIAPILALAAILVACSGGAPSPEDTGVTAQALSACVNWQLPGTLNLLNGDAFNVTATCVGVNIYCNNPADGFFVGQVNNGQDGLGPPGLYCGPVARGGACAIECLPQTSPNRQKFYAFASNPSQPNLWYWSLNDPATGCKSVWNYTVLSDTGHQ